MITRFVMPFSETNISPTLANFQNPENGVRSQLSTQLKSEPEYNGLKIADMRGLKGIHQMDKLDTLAVATQKLQESAKVYKQSALHTAFAKRVTNNKR